MKIDHFSSLKIFLVIFIASLTAFASQPKAPTNLRSCDKVQPVGTDDKPYFGWYVNDSDDNEIQSAYQILVASTMAALESGKGDVWDSGKIISRSQNYISFKGNKLSPATRYYWKVRTWDKDGNPSPYASVSYFDTGLFNSKEWEGANWIKRNTTDADDYTYYRKSVSVPKKNITRAIVYVSANHNYELYLNGKEIGKGLAYHYPQYAYYNAYDITSLVKPNAGNIFACLTHWYGGGQGRAPGERGFLLKTVIEYADGTKTIVGTDNSWKQKQAEVFITGQPRRNGEGIGYIDKIDSRNEEPDWNKLGFDDSGWEQAVVIGAPPVAPWIADLQPDLTRVIEKQITPASVKSLGNGKYLIDLGKIYAGMPQINFEGGNPGDVVSMRGGYVLKPDGSLSTEIDQQTNLEYFFLLNGNKAVFKPMLYLSYRYLQVDNSPNALTTDNVRFISRHYELDPSRTEFISSDTMLNQVWSLMMHSLIVGAHEGFLDTPTREKGAFLGDAWSQGVASMLAMGERSLNLRVMLEFLDSQDQYWPDGRLNAVYPNVDGKRDIPDYTQSYLVWTWDYYLQTGNIDFLKSNYSKLKKIADYVDTYRDASTGLIHNLAGGSGPYRYGIIDWPAQMRYGYDMTTEAKTVINAYAYADFDIISKIAATLGNQQDSDAYKNKAIAIKEAINSKLINADGVYVDGLKPDRSQSTHVSQHANMYPLALGIVPEKNRKVVIDIVKQKEMSVGMVTLRYLPEAIGEAGEAEHLLKLYTNTGWDGWAKTISLGGTVTWESWDAHTNNQSMSHPWGAIGLAGIQQYILGVKTLRPQHEVLQVKPLDFKGTLSRVSGSFPTDKGNIAVSWDRDDKRFLLTLSIPDNVEAKVYIPKSGASGSKLKVDGKEVSAKEEGDYLLIENTGSGKHTFERALK